MRNRHAVAPVAGRSLVKVLVGVMAIFFYAFLMLMGDASVCGGEIFCKYYYIMC